MRASGTLGALIGLAILAADAGSPPVDLTKELQVNQVLTGWFDAGIVNGQNKLVPSISFTLKNVADQHLIALQINAIFRRVTDKTEWRSRFVTVTRSPGLAPGATTEPLIVRSPLGYTGSDQ